MQQNLTDEQIATRAYFIWEEQGRPEGQDESNWYQAMNELTQESKPLTKTARG